MIDFTVLNVRHFHPFFTRDEWRRVEVSGKRSRTEWQPHWLKRSVASSNYAVYKRMSPFWGWNFEEMEGKNPDAGFNEVIRSISSVNDFWSIPDRLVAR